MDAETRKFKILRNEMGCIYIYKLMLLQYLSITPSNLMIINKGCKGFSFDYVKIVKKKKK